MEQTNFPIYSKITFSKKASVAFFIIFFGSEDAMADKDPVKNCPVCGSAAAARLVEDYFQPVLRKRYSILRCADCGADFSDPMDNPPPGTYPELYPDVEAFPGMTADWRFETFFANVPAPRKILDIGCGWGLFIHFAILKGYDASGIDYSPQKTPGAETLAPGRITRTYIPDFLRQAQASSLDAVTLFDVLEHLDDPRGVLREAARILNPGGLIAVTVPDRRSCKTLINRHYDSPPHHLTRWDPAAMQAALEKAGFSVRSTVQQPLTFAALLTRFVSPVTTFISRTASGAPSGGAARMEAGQPARRSIQRKAAAIFGKAVISTVAAAPALILYLWCLLFKPYGPAFFMLAERKA